MEKLKALLTLKSGFMWLNNNAFIYFAGNKLLLQVGTFSGFYNGGTFEIKSREPSDILKELKEVYHGIYTESEKIAIKELLKRLE